MSVFNYQKDQQGIVTITMDMTGPVNAMNAEYKVAMHEAVNRLEQEQGLVGVILASAKRVFFAGADLKDLVRATPDHAEEIYRDIQLMKHDMRRLEKLPVPVVAAINGAALGGGYELSLACNRRIAVNHRAVKIGLPECSLGLFPAGGGIVRLTHLIGVQAALDIILASKQMIPEKALAVGMIDQLVETLDDLIPAAKRWLIDVESDTEAARQPWDRKGHKVAGGAINTPKNAQYAAVAPTMLHQKTRGLLPNATAAMDIAFQASMLDVDTALRIESREFVKVVTGAVAKNMITTFFFQLNQINAGASRPQGVAKNPTRKLGVLGAGMMGQGIAYVAAMAGIQVVLKDMTLAAAEKGKAYTIALLAKQTSRGRLDTAKAEVIADLIKPTVCDTDLAGCDLIIEAVFENLSLIHI